MNKRILALFFLFAILIGCETQKISYTPPAPEIGQDLRSSKAMVSSAHKLASKIGADIMQKGGNAIDAAVATAFAVSVLEPEMSGIGGGGAMLIWRKGDKDPHYLDFYPSKRVVTFAEIEQNGENEDLWEIGVPGEVAGLLYALEKFGNLSRQEVMEPAIKLAKNGFAMYPTLSEFIVDYEDKLKKYEGGEMFFPSEKPFPIGGIFKNPELAESLSLISKNGAQAFYDGELTSDIIKAMNEGGNPVTLEDFQNYRINTDRGFLKTNYKGWQVYTAPPPQGGLEIVEALNLLEPFDLKDLGLPTQSDSTFHLLTAAMRGGIADRKFSEDPNFKKYPLEELTSKEYARKRSSIVFNSPIIDSLESGKFEMTDSAVDGGDFDGGETTSLSVIDENGNAVVLTHTLSYPFGGNGVYVRGFFLNNSGIKFSKASMHEEASGNEYRTRYSTIAPTIILDKEKNIKMAIGAPGGGRIGPAIIQNIVYILDFEMDPATSARMPRIYPFSDKPWTYIEKGYDNEVLRGAYERGYRFYPTPGGYARIYIVEKNKDGVLRGAADPKHEGGVSGY